MRRTDRLLGILMQLDDQRPTPASELAARFEVSIRTIYRDMDALGELGIPFYARTGRDGGFQLVEGYRLPPIMFSEGEAISLLLGITLLASLRARPYAADLEAAGEKLLGALPPNLERTLRQARRLIGFEKTAMTAFHIEHADPGAPSGPPERENDVLARFLGAVLAGDMVRLRYQSPYRPGEPRSYRAQPAGLFWDRDCWYLTGVLEDGEQRVWRADRVLEIETMPAEQPILPAPDLNAYLDRAWLAGAMRDWAAEYPVKILLTPAQAARLRQDWYYRHAHYEEQPDGRVLLTFGQDRPEIALELARWLGPGAELVEPRGWRALLRHDLAAMLECYTDNTDGG